MRTLSFWFDFISPYAYLAWTQVHALAGRCGVRVAPRPVLFAGLLNHHGQQGPAEIPAKREHMIHDTLRRADLLGVPFAPPPTHPFNPLLGLRAVLAAPEADRRALIDGLYAATWGEAEAKGIDDPEVVAAVAEGAGLDADDLLARASGAPIKQALREATDTAIAAGVFGVPTLIVDDALFWGFDTFDLLERHLREGFAVDPDAVARFRSVRPSARRR